ncbi:thada/death receptor interacting protein [Babesia gibsoni]|uniref:Thada/death receptor interacting protein n=1 Tax=Babesia gibsoni TaxID=33632 RepID=A0AAD8LNU9_BABGI|nr:thada/death receptor interacting protein [Babesia gibsoni]
MASADHGAEVPGTAAMAKGEEQESCSLSNSKVKVPSFSKSQKLRKLHDNVVAVVSRDPHWNFNIQEVSPTLARGQISKALFDLEAYVRDAVTAHQESGAYKRLEEIIEATSTYVIHLFLEAEWLCLSKGFSSSCTSFLRLVPAVTLTRTIKRCLTPEGSQNEETIHARISNLYALATCDDFLKLMDNDVLNVAMELVATVGFETYVTPEGADILSASDAVSYHKSRISALKALNLLLFNIDRRASPGAEGIEGNTLDRTIRSILRTLGDVTVDRDVVCQCGVSFLGLLHISHYADRPTELESAIQYFLGSKDKLRRKFEGDDEQFPTLYEDMLDSNDIAKPEDLVTLLLALPSLGCLSVVRGILTFLLSVYGKGMHTDGSDRSNDIHVIGKHVAKTSFVTATLCLCHGLFKMATDCSIRVDINFATLQGVQLMMSFITQEAFHLPELYKCMLDLPELVLTYWTRKIRRIFNLAVCAWQKLMEECFHLAEETRDPVIVGYTQKLINIVTGSFGTNLKLRYLALQNLLKYVGPEEILKIQPFLIPHLLCSLSVPAIKGCTKVFITDLLTRIYSDIKETCGQLNTTPNTPLMVLHCLVYPTVIAILHSRQLILPRAADDKLIPPREAGPEELELRVSAVAESFKGIFGKIQREYVFEMLRLSTSFTKCDFYGYLSRDEQNALSSSGGYVVKDHSDLGSYTKQLISRMRELPSAMHTERIMYLTEPFNFAESICLCNARTLNSVEFVDTQLDSTHIRGAIINDSPTDYAFDPSKLQCFPQVRLFYIPMQKLLDGLGSIKSDIALNVLKTVACSPKSKQQVSPLELELILYALHHCMKTSLPAFRQHFVASMKPFIRRVYTIITSNQTLLEECLRKKIGSVMTEHELSPCQGEKIKTKLLATEAEEIVIVHCIYMKLLMKKMVATINPCTSDFKNTTALELLYMTLTIFSEDSAIMAQVMEIYKGDLIVPIYMALFYMSTRQQDLIFKILQLIRPTTLCHDLSHNATKDPLGYICRKASSSLWSIKSLPYISGAKALTLLLRAVPPTEEAKQALLSGDLAAAINMPCTVPDVNMHHDSVLSVLEYLLSQLQLFCSRLETHVDIYNPSNASSPAGILSLYSHYLDSIPVSVYSKVTTMPEFPAYLDTFYANVKRICDRILKYVGREHDLDENYNKDYQIDCRGHLITKDTSSDFTCTSSPEKGYMQCRLCSNGFHCYETNMLSTPKCSIQDDSNLRPITVLCWKAIFESCEAMRAMLQWILPQSISGSIALCSVRAETVEDPGTNVPLIYDKINDIGHYIISSLMSCRHFGCTDALADLLTWLCKKLVILGLQGLLKEWLSVLLELLKGYSVSDQQWNDLFVMLRDSHRRSEPIGRSFTSILKAESDRHKPVLLPLVVNTLLELCNADRPYSEDSRNGFTVVDIRIHSLNILCALFRCKELRWSNNVHAGAALCTSLRNMSHGDWSVRNSASLLFSSVLHHLVGNDVNSACTEALLDQKLALCNNKELSDQLNTILRSVHEMTVLRSENYENLNPPPEYSALYQSSTFVFNFLSRIPLYSFPPDVAFKLSENITESLSSSNAAIRVMSAKILAKNYMDSSQSNFCSIIIDRCKEILSEVSHSNKINGILLLIKECIDIVVSSGLFNLLERGEENQGMLEWLPVARGLMNKNIANVSTMMESWTPKTFLFVTMYRIMVKSNCFENVILPINILETACIAYARTANIYDMVAALQNLEYPRKQHILECMTLLATYSAKLLGDEVHKQCLGTGMLPYQKELIVENDNLTKLVNGFERIRNDDMVKTRAASVLVNSTFVITCCTSVKLETSENLVGPFAALNKFLLEELRKPSHGRRVLEAVINKLCFLAEREQLIPFNREEWHCIWQATLKSLSGSSPHYISIAMFKMLNTIGLHILKSGLRESGIFDRAWESAFKDTVCERLLHNTDFMLEAWKSGHLYALYHYNSTTVDKRVLEIAAGLLMKVIDPASDITLRKLAAKFLNDSLAIIPINGKYPSDARGHYTMHVLIALMVILQDESDQIRLMAVSCCASIIRDINCNNLGNLQSQMSMEKLLEFMLQTMPVEWVIRAFDQLTMLNKELYNPINHKLQFMNHRLLQKCIYLSTAAMEWKTHGTKEVPDLSVLAEMDTVFNVEPQNMYTETLIYMVYVDKLLCRVVRSVADTARKPLVDEDTSTALSNFATKSAERTMNTLRDHLHQNYEVCSYLMNNNFGLGRASPFGRNCSPYHSHGPYGNIMLRSGICTILLVPTVGYKQWQ